MNFDFSVRDLNLYFSVSTGKDYDALKMGPTKLCHHPPPAKIYPPPPTITHHHPPPAEIYPPTPTTTHQQPKPFL